MGKMPQSQSGRARRRLRRSGRRPRCPPSSERLPGRAPAPWQTPGLTVTPSAATGTAGHRGARTPGGRRTFISRNVLHLHVPHLGHVAQHGEDDEAREEAGEAVHRAGDQRIPGRQKAGRRVPGQKPPASGVLAPAQLPRSPAPPPVPSPSPACGKMGKGAQPGRGCGSCRDVALPRSCPPQPHARCSPVPAELTGSSCCGRGCNWPERGERRSQGPRRRKPARRHQPRPGRRSNGRAGERAGGPQGWEVPAACPPHGVPARGAGTGSVLVPLPCLPMSQGRGAAGARRGLVPTLGSCSSRIKQRQQN